MDQFGNIKSVRPETVVSKLVLRSIPGAYPGGKYVVTYDGVGKVTVHFDVVKTTSSQPGRIEFEVDSSRGSGILVRVGSVDTKNPVRNVRLFHADHEKLINASQVFDPLFLKDLEGTKMIRFLSWIRTNHSTAKHWADRTTTQHTTQHGVNGVAYEYMIDLCNKVGADPWITIPHLATDDYLEKLTTLFRDRLNPSLRVWLEPSNEITFNHHFSQTQWAHEQARTRSKATGKKVISYDIVAELGLRAFRMAEKVFGDDFEHRVVCVVSGQNAVLRTAKDQLERSEIGKYADVVAVAPYFSGSGKTVDEVIANTNIHLQSVIAPRIKAYTSYLRKNWPRIKLVAYEAGQHLSASGLGVELLTAANDDERMGRLYLEYFDIWRDAGGGTIAFFNDTARAGKYGD